MEQFARALEAGIELLLVAMTVALEDTATTLREDNQRGAIANRDGPHEVFLL